MKIKSLSILCLLFLALEGQENRVPYSIEEGDVLEILVLGEENLTRQVMVMEGGYISFPLIGEIMVAGLTTEEAEKKIAKSLERFFTHPIVSVIFTSPTIPKVSIFGEVMRPGAVEYQRGFTLTDYIALAGGPTDGANLGEVTVVRTIERKTEVLKINVDEIIKKGLKTSDIELKNGDWVYVPEKFRINWTTVLYTLSLALTTANLIITLTR